MRLNQRGIIVPLILFGVMALISGIGLVFYFLFYPKQKSVVITPQPTIRPVATDIPDSFILASPSPFVVQSASPSADLNITYENFKDEYLTLLYPAGFDVLAGNADISQNSLSGSELLHSVAFFAPQSDNGFSVDVWSNKQQRTVSDWWKEIFAGSVENRVRGAQLHENDLGLGKQIGSYQVYKLSLESQGSFYVFAYKNWIIVLSTTMGNTEKVIESIQ